MKATEQWMADALAKLAERSRRRSLRAALPLANGWVELAGERLLNLSGNDYLGLGAELTGEVAPGEAGATASRLVVGNHPFYAELEAAIAELKGSEAALVIGSGFLANSGVIPALAGRGDTIYCDKLNHASIIDGCLLSRARLQRYRHNDVAHLAELLERQRGGRALIVTDAVFSMDGDLAPLRELVAVKERHDAMLMVDEAHSGGVYGERGEGLVHQLGLQDRVEVQMGTFSKAYGGYGAYIAGSRILIDYLINRARSVIFSTGLPPVTVRLNRLALARAAAETWRRERLWSRAEAFRERLVQSGFETGASASQIVPVIVGEDAVALRFSELLRQAGIGAVAIRPPTVPDGTARLRFSVSAAHRWDDLEAALQEIERIGRELSLLSPSTGRSP